MKPIVAFFAGFSLAAGLLAAGVSLGAAVLIGSSLFCSIIAAAVE